MPIPPPLPRPLPLQGIRVVEFVHVVMGPTCGLVLADLGAEVIKVEPLDGDHTRKLTASGAGFFPTFNRNKKSIAVDLKSKAGRDVVLKLVKSAEVLTENFRPGSLSTNFAAVLMTKFLPVNTAIFRSFVWLRNIFFNLARMAPLGNWASVRSINRS